MKNPINLKDLLLLLPSNEGKRGPNYLVTSSGELQILRSIFICSEHLGEYDSLIIDNCTIYGRLSIVDVPISKINNLAVNSFWSGALKIYRGGLTSLKGITQHSGGMDLSHNKITSLEGFVMKGDLDLDHNELTSLSGFIHSSKDTLWVEYNKITSLEGFECKGESWLEGNPMLEEEFIYWDGYSNSPGMLLNLPSGDDIDPLLPTLEANSMVKNFIKKVKSLRDEIDLIF